jgi:hypothetical protein
MADFSDEFLKDHMDAVRAGAAGRTGEVREPVSYLKFTEVDPMLKKSVKKAAKKSDAATKKKSTGKLKAKATAKKPASSGGQQGPPPKTALQKRLLDIGWKRYEQYLNEGWNLL